MNCQTPEFDDYYWIDDSGACPVVQSAPWNTEQPAPGLNIGWNLTADESDFFIGTHPEPTSSTNAYTEIVINCENNTLVELTPGSPFTTNFGSTGGAAWTATYSLSFDSGSAICSDIVLAPASPGS